MKRDWRNKRVHCFRHLVATIAAETAGIRYGYLSEAAVREGLEARSARTSVILTGRDAKPGLCEYADLVSEMRAVKHPFEAGIKAVRGIDF